MGNASRGSSPSYSMYRNAIPYLSMSLNSDLSVRRLIR